MLSNYITTLFRNMRRQKFNTTVNVIGLTAGISFALLIGLFIRGEMAVNQNLKDVERLYLVETNVQGQESEINFFTAGLLTRTAAEQYPGVVENYYRFWDRNITVSKGDKHFRIQSMIGDPSALEMFGLPVLHGEVSPAQRARAVIISEEVALKFFGRTNVVNETLEISTEVNGLQDYSISAVVKEPEQKNTVTDLMDMNAQIFLSLHDVKDFLPGADPDRWDANIISYVKLAPGTDKATAEGRLNQLLQTQAPKVVSDQRKIELAPLADYYLLTNHSAVMKLIVTLTVIVGFILLLSLTNFVNVAIGTALRRAKEVGVRKVIGGMRYQLVFQFLLESTVLSLMSTTLSLLLYQLLGPYFNSLLNTGLPSVVDFPLSLWVYIVGGAVMVGILAGVYPAVFQSRLKPSESLKGKSGRLKGTLSFSRVLLAIQFVITLFVLTATIVLYRQTNYMLNTDLGFTASNVITVTSVPRNWTEAGFQQMESAKTLFLQSPKVEAVSLSWGAPSFGMGGLGPVMYKAESTVDKGIQINVTGVDERFDETFGLTMREGNFLCPSTPCYQPLQIVLNEAAADALNISLGDKVKLQGNDTTLLTITGIVKNFNYQSMHEPVKPALFLHNRDFGAFRFLTFRLQPSAPSASLAEVERLWKSAFPNEAFTYEFADQRLAAQYKTELQLKNASSVAIVLMLIMVLTGLLGLVSLNVSRRVKEIGIRKVLGASVPNILNLISKEYAVLVIISFVVAVPLAYYFAERFVANFAYRVPLTWWMFVLPGVVLLGAALLIVVVQSYNAAATDPVKTLRSE
jgi:putative ABC transport system permease protein